jgi:hypothetical protein
MPTKRVQDWMKRMHRRRLLKQNNSRELFYQYKENTKNCLLALHQGYKNRIGWNLAERVEP